MKEGGEEGGGGQGGVGACKGIDAGLLVEGGGFSLDLIFVLSILFLDGVNCWLQLLLIDCRLHLKSESDVNFRVSSGLIGI